MKSRRLQWRCRRTETLLLLRTPQLRGFFQREVPLQLMVFRPVTNFNFLPKKTKQKKKEKEGRRKGRRQLST